MQRFLDKAYNLASGKPTIEQLREWRDNRTEVEFTVEYAKNCTETTKGCIFEINEVSGYRKNPSIVNIYLVKPYSWLTQNNNLGIKYESIRLDQIISFSVTESIYILDDTDSKDCLYLSTNTENNGFKVNKRVLSERSEYFHNKKLNSNEKITLDGLTENELSLLLKALEYKDINHLNFNEAISILVIAEMLADTQLINATKNLIFTTATIQDFQSLKSNPNNRLVIQRFLNNLQTEIITWAEINKKSSQLALYCSQLNFDEIKMSKHLKISIPETEPEEADTKIVGRSGKLPMSNEKIASSLLWLLQQCDYTIEKLSIQDIHSSQVDAIFTPLQSDSHLKSIEITLRDWFLMDSNYSNINFSETKSFLSYIKNTKSLTSVTIRPNPTEKTSNLIKKYVEANRFYNNASLLFFATKYDENSAVYANGFDDCMKHMIELDKQDEMVEADVSNTMSSKT